MQRTPKSQTSELAARVFNLWAKQDQIGLTQLARTAPGTPCIALMRNTDADLIARSSPKLIESLEILRPVIFVGRPLDLSSPRRQQRFLVKQFKAMGVPAPMFSKLPPKGGKNSKSSQDYSP